MHREKEGTEFLGSANILWSGELAKETRAGFAV